MAKYIAREVGPHIFHMPTALTSVDSFCISHSYRHTPGQSPVYPSVCLFLSNHWSQHISGDILQTANSFSARHHYFRTDAEQAIIYYISLLWPNISTFSRDIRLNRHWNLSCWWEPSLQCRPFWALYFDFWNHKVEDEIKISAHFIMNLTAKHIASSWLIDAFTRAMHYFS